MEEKAPPWHGRIPHSRYVLFLVLLLLLPWPLSFVLPGRGIAVVAGFDLAVLAFIATIWPLWQDSIPDDIRREAARNDAGQFGLLLLTATIILMMLIAVGMLLAGKEHLSGWQIVLIVMTLLFAWLFSNLVYSFHYARLYYAQASFGKDHGGLEFPGEEEPVFADFVNFAFVIGMTCQTADINITRPNMRRVATAHGLLAFIFNLGVLAMTVNVVASVI